MHEASSGQCQVPKGMADASQVHKNFNQGITMLFRCQKGLKMLPERWNNVLAMWEQGLRPWEMGLGDPDLRQGMVGRGWSAPHSIFKNAPPKSGPKVREKLHFASSLCMLPTLSLAFLLKIGTHTIWKIMSLKWAYLMHALSVLSKEKCRWKLSLPSTLWYACFLSSLSCYGSYPR